VNAERHLENYFRLWMTHDPAAMAALYAEDAVMEDPTLVEPRVGRDAIERYYAEMFGELERPEHALLDFASRGERAWFEWSFGSGGERSPRVSYHGVSIQTLRDGLIVHDDAFWNPA